MNATLVGLFDTQADATAAHGKLMAAGFAASALSLTSGSGESSGMTASTSSGMTGSTSSSMAGTMSTSGGNGSTHHAGGAIANFFENLFGSDDDAHDTDRVGHTNTYTEAFKRGSFALTVKTTSEAEMDQAESILNAAGAVDVDERADEWRKDGWVGGTALSAGAMKTSTNAGNGTASSLEAGGTQKLQELQEELNVGKRAVARGGVRVFTRMTEAPVEESVTLREEHADIKRTSVDRAATDADFAAFKEGTIEVREMAEEAVVSKTARVTGEVEVGKTATEREETIRDTVRQTKVEVEQIASETAAAGGLNRNS